MMPADNTRLLTHPIRKHRCAAAIAWLCLAITVLSGCGPSRIVDETYGRRRGRKGGASVNGTAVLGHLFKKAGYRVRSWGRLSARLDKDDVLVLVVDSFSPPPSEFCDHLENWLAEQSGRTLIVVGRDYSAAIQYWRDAAPRTTPAEAEEAQRRLARAIVEHDSRRSLAGETQECKWYRLDYDQQPRKAQRLGGNWSQGLNPARVNIPLHAKLELLKEAESVHWGGTLSAEPLFKSGDEIIATRLTRNYWDQSQIIVISNGSFLLNLPLVDLQNRILAGKLIAQCGNANRVTFLEGTGYLLREADDNRIPTGWEAFTQWPMGAILIHLTIVGMIFCFAVFPIFGKPRRADAAANSDFGKHVHALGGLLEGTGDAAYARQQLKHYQESVDTKHLSAHSAAPAKKTASPTIAAVKPRTPRDT